jgi:hypothetical protein
LNAAKPDNYQVVVAGLDRAIQYSRVSLAAATSPERRALEYWFPAFAGMTAGSGEAHGL